MTVFKTARLLLKYTNPAVLALALGWAGACYYLYQSKNKAVAEHKAAIARVISDNNTLREQLASERQAAASVAAQQKAAAEKATARNQRLKKAMQNKSVQQASQRTLSPLLKHSLNELRQRSESDD